MCPSIPGNGHNPHNLIHHQQDDFAGRLAGRLRLNDADQLFFDQIAGAASQNGALQKAAEVNSLDKCQLVFRQVLESLFIERMELNEELFADYMGKPDMQELVCKSLGSQVYKRLSPGKSRPSGDTEPIA